MKKTPKKPKSQTQRVLDAVRRGGQDAKTIAKMARVPEPNVHPLLNRLRGRGKIAGYTGTLRAVDPPPEGL